MPSAPPGPADAAGACAFAVASWRVLPSTAPRLLAWAGESLDDGAVEQVEALRESVAVLARLQTRLALRFTQALDHEGIHYCLLKASAARLSAYRRPEERGSLDIDVAVPRPAIRRAEAIAHDLGFVSAMLVGDRRNYRRVPPVLQGAVEAGHYELATLARRQVVTGLSRRTAAAVRASMPTLLPWHEIEGEPACYVTLDLHHGLSLDIDVDEVVESAERVMTEEGSAVVPSCAWHVFHLIFKIYWEGVHNYATGGYQYADLVRLVPRLTAPDAHELIGLLRAYRLEAAAFYVLRRLEPHFGVSVPEVLEDFVASEALCPEGVYPHEVNDLGDVWPKLWGRR